MVYGLIIKFWVNENLQRNLKKKPAESKNMGWAILNISDLWRVSSEMKLSILFSEDWGLEPTKKSILNSFCWHWAFPLLFPLTRDLSLYLHKAWACPQVNFYLSSRLKLLVVFVGCFLFYFIIFCNSSGINSMLASFCIPSLLSLHAQCTAYILLWHLIEVLDVWRLSFSSTLLDI